MKNGLNLSHFHRPFTHISIQPSNNQQSLVKLVSFIKHHYSTSNSFSYPSIIIHCMHNPLLNSFPYSYSLLVPFQSFLFNTSSNGTNYKRIRYISTLFPFPQLIVQFTFQNEHTISLNKDFLKSHPNTLFSIFILMNYQLQQLHPDT